MLSTSSLLTRSLTRAASRRPFRIHVQRIHTSSARSQTISRFKPLALGVGLVLGASLLLRPSVRLDAVAQLPSEKVLQEEETIVDPATSIEFPKTLRVPAQTSIPPLTCIGVGVRTVSFLGIKVYSVGFYADLNNPHLKLEPNMTPEQKIEEIVKKSACVIRIIPTRSTSFSHLRDAFMRALYARLGQSRKAGTISEDEATEVAVPLRKLKTLFPNTALNKHTPFDVFLSEPAPGKPRAIIFRDLGAIEHDWVSTELVLHYFEGDGPSPPMKKAVLDRVQSL